MSDEAALLQAIYANPDDDTPRLVYADWLDEHDQPERAEFIRVQVELSHLTDEDPRERPLRDRRWELWAAHHEQWTAELGIVESDNVKVEFRRGFIDELSIHADIPGAVDLVCRVPGARRLSLWRVALTPDAVQKLAALDLDSLWIGETLFALEWLELLEPLPCGTVLEITPNGEPFPPDVWHEFQARRIGRLAQLPPEERYTEARRWQRGRDERHGYTRGSRSIYVKDVKACDAELQLLAELKDVEEVRIDEGDITPAGIGQIAKLPKLKSLELFWVPATSIAPLIRCTSLEKLRAIPEYGVQIGDDGTAGIEQLTNLRELTLRASGAGDSTLTRLGALHKLKSLDIELGQIVEPDSYRALAHLTALEQLKIDGDVPGFALRHLERCSKLQSINLQVPVGTADDFAPLGTLAELRELHVKGEAVTDEAVRHLAPLKNLRTLLAQGTEVSPNGARWLADQLFEATIVLDEFVAKSPRKAITFCRRLAEDHDYTSAMVPTHWCGKWGRSTAEPCRPLTEHGWENIQAANYEVVAPAEIRLYGRDESSPGTVVAEFFRLTERAWRPRLDERDVVNLGDSGTSCVYSAGRNQYLLAVVASEGKCAVLECEAPKTRFEEFRALFLFVARSLRVGPDALVGVGEEVTVPVSQL